MDPNNAVHIQMPTLASQEEEPSSTQDDATKPPPPQQMTDAAATPEASSPVRPTVSLSCASSDLLKLLPTGTVLAFQALAPSFSNSNHGGVCHDANRCLVLSLISACTVSCVLLSFTDSLVGRDGRLYHGAATFGGFYPFNCTEREATLFKRQDLSRLRITALDFVHAFFSALVFLAVALADAGVQGCLFPDAGPDVRQLLVNLPLGTGFLSSMVFIIFPTTRKSIGYTDMTPHAQ